MKYFVTKQLFIRHGRAGRIVLHAAQRDIDSGGAHHNVMHWSTGTPAHVPGQRLELANGRKHSVDWNQKYLSLTPSLTVSIIDSSLLVNFISMMFQIRVESFY